MKLILPREIADVIQPRLPDSVSVVWAEKDGTIAGDAADAEVYFNGFYLKKDAFHRVLQAAPQLRWQHSPSAGVNHILIPQFLERDILLTSSVGIYAIPIAEFVLTYMLNHVKQTSRLRSLQAQHQWQQDFELNELTEKTLLILGAGGIGQAIATRARAFGMRVWGSRRSPQPTADFDQIVGEHQWQALLPEVDFLTIATPLTPATQGMINAAVLKQMRSTAYLINIARGKIVNSADLLTALQQGWIAGAALDTVDPEPLPIDHPFWDLPNVVITPHCSGSSPQVLQRTIDLFLDNLDRYQQGQPLRNVVNQQAGY